MKCKCSWCDEEAIHVGCCNRHYQQMNLYGEFKHTRYDKHHFIIKEDYALMPIYDEQGEVRAEILIDIEDIERVKQYKWHMKYNGNTHVEGKINGKVIQLHRFIMNEINSNILIDHINRNPLDNRKSNLRKCNRSENNSNRKIHTNNKLGIKNIDYHQGQYRVSISKNGKQKCYGHYATLEEAIEVRDKKLKELHGEFASQG